MSKLVQSVDVNNANKDNINNLEKIANSAREVSTLISSFDSGSKSVLIGGGYDAVRTKLNIYTQLYSMVSTLCENVISAITNANNSMLNYMEGYTLLDNSKLEEYITRLNQINGYINYLESHSSENNDNSSLILYWRGIYTELSHYKKLLENLDSTDNNLYNGLDSIIADITNISRAVMGINESTFTSEGMRDIKNGTTSMYNFDPSIQIFGYDFDISNMSPRAQQLLENLQLDWPSDLEPERYIAIQTALTLIDKGITYSMSYRHAKNSNGFPLCMDCSSFVTYCLNAAGYNVPAGAYTGTYLSNKNFTAIDRSNLKPGDVGLMNSSSSGNGANHIGMYLGTDSNGKEIWIECSGSGIIYGKNPNQWNVFRTYNGY